MTNLITLDHIKRASKRIAAVARRTPIERSQWLSKELGREVFLKLECFQPTGSFKIRGAMAKLTSLNKEEQKRGVLTVSAGNHGLAIAVSAERLGISATVIVPRSASSAKREAISRYPVKLIEQGENYDEAERIARAMGRANGAVFVSPYNDAEVIAGQGTVAIEMLEEEPELDAIVVPVGGGGLIAGVAIAAKTIRPGVKIYGAEPAASPTMTKALEAGRIVEIEEEATIADGLAGNIEPDSITFPIVRQLVDDIILVNEHQIATAIAQVAREDHLMIEGAAGVAVAALADRRIQAHRVAAIITGRNISLDLFLRAIRA
jgi:threonine dehydratase